MNNDELSVAIANTVNGLCEEHGQGDRVAMMNAMANICNFCIRSMMLNAPHEVVISIVDRMCNESSLELLMAEKSND